MYSIRFGYFGKFPIFELKLNFPDNCAVCTGQHRTTICTPEKFRRKLGPCGLVTISVTTGAVNIKPITPPENFCATYIYILPIYVTYTGTKQNLIFHDDVYDPV